MGEIELRHRKRMKKGQLQKIILQTVALTGTLSVAMVAPNVISAMAKLKLLPQKSPQQSIYVAKRKLIEQGFLKKEGRNIVLTKKGEAYLDTVPMQPLAQKRWDKKWRILMFDIPEKKRRYRDFVRIKLKEVGFVKLQDSAWVYPYPAEDFIQLLKTELKLGSEMIYIIADEIENDARLKKHFSLS